MTSSSHGRACLLVVAAAAVILSGCASPGIPRPPSLYLPATVTDFSASRIGDRVEFHWTAPSRTTDGLDLVDPRPVPTTAEICRDVVQEGARAERSPGAGAGTPCTPVLRAAGHPGVATAIDFLPPELTSESSRGTSVAYRVRVVNERGRSAAASARVLIPAGPPLGDVVDFRAVQTKDGVVLEWKGGGDGKVEVIRTLVSSDSGVHPSSTSPGGQRPDRQKGTIRGHQTEPSALKGGSGRLEGGSASLVPGPSGGMVWGMLDSGALADKAYLYQAQRVGTVPLGGGSVVVRSEPTAPVKIEMRDTFPPSPPSGLATVPGTGGSSGSRTGSSIDLSWQPNIEADLAGYLVYRTDLGPKTPETKPRKLTQKPLPGPAFRDTEVITGERYEYRVTAVDQLGNESQPSASQTDSAAEPF